MLRTRVLIAAAVLGLGFAGQAAADPIEGNFRTPKTGATAKVAKCGAQFCMTYTSGEHSGKRFATMKPNGDGSYSGSLTDLSDGGKEYKGKAKISGKDISVGGCILGGLICDSQTFKRL